MYGYFFQNSVFFINKRRSPTYLADDVNKVFAKVSKKISRVKIERLLTRARLLKKNHQKLLRIAVTMTALDSQYITTKTLG